MSAPFISIVTISFNQARFLRQTIDSVLQQGDADIEYIVVDPGSTDGSRDIIAGYGASISRVILEPDQGPADGLNKGFATATGRIGYFLNSDDYLLPGAIAKLKSAWTAHPDARFLLCRAWRVDADGRPLRELVPTPIRVPDLKAGAATIVQQGLSFTMGLFREVGGFNPRNRSCWDYELLAEFARHRAPYATSDERIGAFRLYDESITGGAAGTAHEARFDDDFRRIHQQILDQRDVGERMAVMRRGRWLKMLANPSHALHRLRELALPGTIEKRWRADQ